MCHTFLFVPAAKIPDKRIALYVVGQGWLVLRRDDKAVMQKTGIARWRQSIHILQSGLFAKQAMRNLFDTISLTKGPREEQWRRLLTLDFLLRKFD